MVWKNQPNTNIIRSEKSPEYEYEYYSVWKYRPNTNTNILVFEYYSNNIRIQNYSLTSGGNFSWLLPLGFFFFYVLNREIFHAMDRRIVRWIGSAFWVENLQWSWSRFLRETLVKIGNEELSTPPVVQLLGGVRGLKYQWF